MKLAIILGSSRSDGFSSKLLECIQSEFENIASIDPIWIKDFDIAICDSDNACKSKICGLKDDMEEICERILIADALLYIPVVQGYGTCSKMQIFLERLGYGFLRPMGRPLQNKLAMVAVVGRRYSHESVFSQVLLNLLLNRCIVVGSGFPPTFRSDKQHPLHDSEAWESLRAGIHRMKFLHSTLNQSELSHLESAHTLQLECP